MPQAARSLQVPNTEDERGMKIVVKDVDVWPLQRGDLTSVGRTVIVAMEVIKAGGVKRLLLERRAPEKANTRDALRGRTAN